MAQELIHGSEVTCGVLDEGGDKVIALPPTLVKLRGRKPAEPHFKNLSVLDGLRPILLHGETPRLAIALAKRAVSPTPFPPRNAQFFDYQAKYTAGAAEEITPAPFTEETIKDIQAIALKAHQILGCAGMSRTDMILRGDDIFVLETNTIPGMTETSLYPQEAKAMGIAFPDLLDKIIDVALNRK
jgi:hypothetical protein